MVELATAPTTDHTEAPVAAWLGDNAESDANIVRYLAAGERMRVLTGVGWKIFAALAVLDIVAWALGLLPGAVRPF